MKRSISRSENAGESASQVVRSIAFVELFDVVSVVQIENFLNLSVDDPDVTELIVDQIGCVEKASLRSVI